MQYKQIYNMNDILNALLLYSNDIIICLANDYSITLLNNCGEKFYNWQLKKILGKNFLELCHNFHYTSPISNHFFDKPTLLNFNLNCKNSINKQCNINWVIYPLKPDGVLIIGKNIELKKNNIAYFLNGIIDAIPGCLYWKDCNGHYLGCNNLTAKLAGLSSPSDVIGKTDLELWSKQSEQMIINDKQVISEGKTIIVEEDLITADGQWMYFTGVKMPLRDENNQIIGLIGNSLDITDKKKLEGSLREAKEKAEAANQAKTEFIANMSHDIRTPLTGVIGLSEILENTLQNPEQKEDAHLLHGSGEELLNMLNDILDDVRAEHMNEGDLHEEAFDLYQCIDDLVRLELPTTKLKKLSLDVVIDSNVPQCIVSDRKKIHRILLNLVGNAIKFTQSGSITIEVTCLNLDSSQVHLQFGVADTGIGIPKALQSQVFDRFFRVSSSYKGLYKGHGLGLHIAQSYVGLLGGHITLTSEEGKGSTFHFDLQCKLGDIHAVTPHIRLNDKPLPVSKSKSPTLLQKPDACPSDLNVPHLLLVEDNPIALKVLESIVTKAGFRFTSASTGEKALELAKTHSFQLVITDIGLPGISGNEFARLLREWEKTHLKTPLPILGLTGHARETAKAECQASGMNEVFSKPISLGQIHDMVKTFALLPIDALQSQEPSKEAINQEGGLGRDLPASEDALFQLNQFPLLDPDEGIKTLGSLEGLKELLAQMVNDEFPKDINALQTAYQTKHWEDVESIAHNIKSSALYCGTVRMKMACQYLERYQKAGHSRLLNELYQQLLSVLEETKTTVLDWLDKTPEDN